MATFTITTGTEDYGTFTVEAANMDDAIEQARDYMDKRVYRVGFVTIDAVAERTDTGERAEFAHETYRDWD